MAIKYADGSDSDGGRVIQVQFTNFGTQYTNNSTPALSNTSFQPTGLTCAITPKSTSSKILIWYDQSWFYQTVNPSSNGTAQGCGLRLYRDSTEITSRSSYNDWYQDIGTANNQRIHGRTQSQFLDSPNTTSAITYSLKIQFHTDKYSELRVQYTDGANTESRSYMTLMELAA
jgi:predicted secreted protein